MASEVRVPASGELGEEIILVRWLKNPGDTVAPGEIVAEIEAAKGVIDIEAVTGGTVLSLEAEEGVPVRPGEVIALIGIPGEEVALGTGKGGRVRAAPAARRLAKEWGIDLSCIEGSGPGGAVLSRDVSLRAELLGKGKGPERVRPAGEETANRKAVAAAVTASHREIPRVTFTAEIGMTRAQDLRESLSLSFDSLFIHALARGIRKSPRFSLFWSEGKIERHDQVDIAFAFGFSGALYIPVLRGADMIGLRETDLQVKELVRKGRSGKLKREDLSGGSLLMSNLGMYPLTRFDAMIYPGQSAAAAFGAVRDVPVVLSGGIFIRPVVTVSLSVDHRIINGREAAEFIAFIKDYLEERIAVEEE